MAFEMLTVFLNKSNHLQQVNNLNSHTANVYIQDAAGFPGCNHEQLNYGPLDHEIGPISN